jgi:hypothetical protein
VPSRRASHPRRPSQTPVRNPLDPDARGLVADWLTQACDACRADAQTPPAALGSPGPRDRWRAQQLEAVAAIARAAHSIGKDEILFREAMTAMQVLSAPGVGARLLAARDALERAMASAAPELHALLHQIAERCVDAPTAAPASFETTDVVSDA